MIEVKIIKDIPKDQIDKFEDKVVYNTAVLTREYTKSASAYPYLTGELERTEVASPITGSNKEYNLLAGVDYAKYVWKMTDVNWTNNSTNPQWYYNVFRKKNQLIIQSAMNKAIGELK